MMCLPGAMVVFLAEHFPRHCQLNESQADMTTRYCGPNFFIILSCILSRLVILTLTMPQRSTEPELSQTHLPVHTNPIVSAHRRQPGTLPFWLVTSLNAARRLWILTSG